MNQPRALYLISQIKKDQRPPSGGNFKKTPHNKRADESEYIFQRHAPFYPLAAIGTNSAKVSLSLSLSGPRVIYDDASRTRASVSVFSGFSITDDR